MSSEHPPTRTHKAVATTARGVVEEITVPTGTPGDHEVLIRVDYAAMIPFDAYQVDRGLVVREYPLVLGFSVSGKIAEVGPGVEDLQVGDRVRCFLRI